MQRECIFVTESKFRCSTSAGSIRIIARLLILPGRYGSLGLDGEGLDICRRSISDQGENNKEKKNDTRARSSFLKAGRRKKINLSFSLKKKKNRRQQASTSTRAPRSSGRRRRSSFLGDGSQRCLVRSKVKAKLTEQLVGESGVSANGIFQLLSPTFPVLKLFLYNKQSIRARRNACRTTRQRPRRVRLVGILLSARSSRVQTALKNKNVCLERDSGSVPKMIIFRIYLDPEVSIYSVTRAGSGQIITASI